jgi:hypothetical protein
MTGARKESIAAYMVDLITAVRDVLCDHLPSVRNAAGASFQVMHRILGKRAIDNIVPSLLERIHAAMDSTEEKDILHVLDGLKQVLLICDHEVLPYLVPELLKAPFSLPSARSLAVLAPTLGKTFCNYIESVAETMVVACVTCDDGEKADYQSCAARLFRQVGQTSVHSLVDMLVLLSEQGTVHTVDAKQEQIQKVRVVASELLAGFCRETKMDYTHDLAQIIQALFTLFAQDDATVQRVGWQGLKDVVAVVDPSAMAEQIPFIRQVLHEMMHDAHGNQKQEFLPGFCLKKGLECFWPVFQQSLLHGTSEDRQIAATGLCEMIDFSPEAALAPLVVKITGPLIRIVGDRVASDVKSAILSTLALILSKTPKHLTALMPHFKTTFSKAVRDTSDEVRAHGSAGLVSLVEHLRRIDPLITDLVSAVEEKYANPDIPTTILSTLSSILEFNHICVRISKPVIGEVLRVCTAQTSDGKDIVRYWAGRSLGTCLQYADAETFEEYFVENIISLDVTRWEAQEGNMIALNALLNASPEKIDAEFLPELMDFLCERLDAKNDPSVLLKSIITTSLVPTLQGGVDSESVLPILTSLLACTTHSDENVRIQALTAINHIAQRAPAAVSANISVLIGPLMARSADVASVKNTMNEAMYFVLQIPDPAESSRLLGIVTSTMSGPEATKFTAYCRKTLANLDPELVDGEEYDEEYDEEEE